MNHVLPFVSVIVACRNEEKYIAKCLDSIFSQDYQKDLMEILIVDGASEDATLEIAARYETQYPTLLRVIKNSQKFIACGWNAGITSARGDLVMLMGAHATYDQSYISKCVEHGEKSRAENVGGILKTVPGTSTLMAKAIAFTLSHQFGSGRSFRTVSNSLQFTDTVFGGCYRKEVFKKIGLFNEHLVRSSDMEFNIRLKKSGGKILCAPDIVAYYYADATWRRFWGHNFLDGIWAVYPLKFTRVLFRPRHLMPLCFVSFLLGLLVFSFLLPLLRLVLLLSLAGYIGLAGFFSVQVALKERDVRYVIFMPIAFATRHFGYGLGSLWGLVKLIGRI